MCPDFKTLSAWFDRELSQEGMNILDRHISHCDKCRKRSEQLKGMSRSLMALDKPVDSASLNEIQQKIMKEKSSSNNIIPFFKKQIGWTTAAGWGLFFCLAALMAGRGLGNRAEQSPSMVDIHQWDESSHFTMDTPSDARMILLEEDGVIVESVIIDLDTSLDYVGESQLVHYVNFEEGD